MTDTKTIRNPSPLVLSVLAIDEHFSDLKRLSARIDEIDLKSNFDFEQSEKLINHYAESGEALSAAITHFVEVLTEARAQAEVDAQKVAAKTDQLKMRKDGAQDKMARFHTLAEKVRLLNDSLLQFRRPEGEVLTEQDRLDLKNQLSMIASQLNGLIDEAQVLKVEGQESKMKVLEQNAESMRQSLIAVSKKIAETVTIQ